MKARRGLLACVTAAVLAGPATGATSVSAPQAESPRLAAPSDPPASRCDLPVLRHHRYKMAGRVRPLLFWIGRDDVGIGEIVWRGEGGAVAYELLIGTDAAKAPRGINRWGYLLEDSRPTGTRVLGVMTTSDEATISDVTSRQAGPQPVGRFKGLDAHIAGGVSRSATETIETEREFSVRDNELVVGRIAAKLKAAAVSDVPVPDGVRPGFLMAVAELVNESMAAGQKGEQALRAMKGRTIAYIYSRRFYDLKLKRVESVRPPARGPARGAVLRVEFETLNRSAGSRNTFELEYAAEGPLAGVPTLIRYKPRWWLEAVLTLEPEPPVPATAGGPSGTRQAGR